MTENGTVLVDTRYHYCLVVNDDGSFTPAVFALSSTQIKKSRAWMTLMAGLKLKDKQGKDYTPPTFSHLYRVTTVPEKNEKGAWRGVAIEVERVLNRNDELLYIAAREFRNQISSGKVKADNPPVQSQSVGDDEY